MGHPARIQKISQDTLDFVNEPSLSREAFTCSPFEPFKNCKASNGTDFFCAAKDENGDPQQCCDLLDMLDDTDNTELPREKYEELGLGDGLFNGKKIKRIVKVQSSDSKTKEGSEKKEGYKE